MNETTKTAAPEQPDGAATPAYWAVIPSDVRYAEDLPAGAKLLYAEISSLTNRSGYCFASNAYFQKLYGISEATVQRYLRALREGGFVSITDGDGGARRRKIYAGINPLLSNPRKNEGVDENPSKNEGVTPAKLTPITRNRTGKNKPPIAPQGAGEPKAAPEWKPERFEAFWRYYPAIPDGNGHGRRPAKDRAIRAWDKLRAGDGEIAVMAAALRRLKESRQWKDGVGIPYASTWLNSRAWREEVEDLKPAVPTAPGEEEFEWLL